MYVPTAARQRLLHVTESRSYISTPLIDMQDVAILGLRSHRILIAGRVQVDRLVLIKMIFAARRKGKKHDDEARGDVETAYPVCKGNE